MQCGWNKYRYGNILLSWLLRYKYTNYWNYKNVMCLFYIHKINAVSWCYRVSVRDLPCDSHLYAIIYGLLHMQGQTLQRRAGLWELRGSYLRQYFQWFNFKQARQTGLSILLFYRGWDTTRATPSHQCNYLSIQCLVGRYLEESCQVWFVMERFSTSRPEPGSTLWPFWFVFLIKKRLTCRQEDFPETIFLFLTGKVILTNGCLCLCW